LPDCFSFAHAIPRAQLLHSQEAWVASDEMEYYLRMIGVASMAKVGEIMYMPMRLNRSCRGGFASLPQLTQCQGLSSP